MCLNLTPDIPGPPPPPPARANEGARNVFEATPEDPLDRDLADGLGLAALRIRPPSLNV